MHDYSHESFEAMMAITKKYHSDIDYSYEDWMDVLMHLPSLGVEIHRDGFIELLKTLKADGRPNLSRACNFLLSHRELIPY